jgi:hypothetical protein
VPSFYSPPSLIINITLPPSSIYFLISYSSYALNGILGPPNNNKSHSFNFFRFKSALFISHYSKFRGFLDLTLYLVFNFYTIFL